MKEEKNVSKLSTIVRDCKTSYYESYTTIFAILALTDLRLPDGMIVVEELANKWGSSWEMKGKN